jgi:quercetin dioxygenase-like cupin family protein
MEKRAKLLLPIFKEITMAIKHLEPNEISNIKSLNSDENHSKTVALFKSKDLELIHLVLNKGSSLPPHKVKGEIIIQCIEGQLDIITDEKSHILAEGQLMYLLGNQIHSVLALKYSSALVTIALVN